MGGHVIIALMGAVFPPPVSRWLRMPEYFLPLAATTLPAILHQVFIRRVPIMTFAHYCPVKLRNESL